MPAFGERAQCGFCVVGAADVVAPVVHERDARVHRLGRGEPPRGVHVVRRIERANGSGRGEIAMLLPVACEAAQQRGPNVPMRFDEARQHEHAGAVDDLGFRRRQPAPDGRDCAGTHVHVAARDVAGAGVHRQDVRVTDQEFAALRHRVNRLLRQAQPERRAAQGAGGDNPTQHLAPVPPRRVHFGLRNAFMKSSTSGAAISAISCAFGCGRTAHCRSSVTRQDKRPVKCRRQRRDVEVAVVCMRLENVLEHRIGLPGPDLVVVLARPPASASPPRRSNGATPACAPS